MTAAGDQDDTGLEANQPLLFASCRRCSRVLIWSGGAVRGLSQRGVHPPGCRLLVTRKVAGGSLDTGDA